MSYEYSYDLGSATATGFGAMFGFLAFAWLIIMFISIFSIVCNWKIYKKAGKQGWEAIVPIYNMIVLLEITNLPIWYLILFIVPIGNIIVMFLIYIELAKKFGKSSAFGIGLVFLNPIFMAILAFSKDCVYQGIPSINNMPIYNNQPMQQPVQGNACTKCGAPTNPGDKFCMNCGNQLL